MVALKKVSIIIPVYNCEKVINRCVRSVFNQTYKNIELILVNDGSKDSSGEKCREIEVNHANTRYFAQENVGAAVARNNGLVKASGDYIMFLDADDELSESIVERLVTFLEADQELDIVACSYKVIETNREEYMFEYAIEANTIQQKEPFFLQLMDYTYGHDANSSTAIGVPWGKMFRKSFLDSYNILFDRNLRRMQDNIFIMEAFYYARKIKYIPEALYHYSVGHINSYGNINYSPENYLGVLIRRNQFIEDHKELNTNNIANILCYERVNYLMMSIHYIIAKGKNRKQILADIKALCNNTIYKTVIDGRNSKLSTKQLVQLFLLKHKLYSLVYAIYKAKYKI